MIKTKWNVEAVKAYETGQGVELVNEPYPHYVPSTTESEKQEHGEPVAWVIHSNGEEHGLDFWQDEINDLPIGTLLYTTPQTKEWVGLTEYEIKGVLGLSESWVGEDCSIPDMIGFAKAIDAKLKEKNT